VRPPLAPAVRAAAIALTLALAGAGVARAQPYDPSFRWHTLETPRFRVHYHQGEEALAQQVAREAERAHALLAPRLGYSAPRTQIVLSDDSDDANGSATPLPYDTVRLFAVPPSSGSELQDYRSWLRQLVQHEYTHILHLDHIGGVPAFVNTIFGKIWPPNGFQASFFLEGVAVLNESEGDPAAGRNASALFDMEARALALDGPFPRLDEVSNQFYRWPLGDVPYLLGGRFMGYLQSQYGPGAIAGFIADQGSVMWPWAPSWAGRRWFGGKEFPALWDEYAAKERAYAEGRRAWVRERPVTAATPLTRRGGDVHGPRFSPDGRFVVYREKGLDEPPAIRRVALDGKDLGRVAIVDANGALAVASPREAIVAIGEVVHEFRVYDDLYRVDLATGHRQRLTRGERATEPDVAPDGTLVYVQRTGGGTMALVRRAPGGPPEVLYAHGGAEVYRPRIAPDGRVAFELHEGGRRDLALWQDGRVEKLTDDDALDTSPAWTPDGRFLLFSSDRGGVFNLYAWEGATGRIRQVTNVEMGAYEPDVSPDGRTIVFASYSRAGWDLATLPLDEASWMEPLAAPPPQPTVGAPPTPEEQALPDPIPSRAYSAWPTVAPTFWLPIVSTDPAGPIYGALTGGTDVLLHHAWTAQGWWSRDAERPGYAVAYQGGWSWPALDLSSSLLVDDSAGPPYRLEHVWNYADVGATFTFTRLARALAFRVGWSGTGYRSIEPQGPIPARWEPYRFRDGFLSEATLLSRYTDARRFVRSISPEEGRTITLTLGAASRELGSDYRLLRARAFVTQYLRVPGTRHVVLGVNAAGGAADGTIGGRAPFELGGATAPDPVTLLPGTSAPPSAQLRGYPVGALAGTGFVLGNLELRFPLADPTRGRSTWPIFLRRVHGALFFDGGDAFDLPGQVAIAGHALSAEELRFSTGAELRLEVVLAYYIRTDIRLGVARPLGALFGRGRVADRDLGIDLPQVAWYVTIGQSF
jgi:hypothetical protein